MGFHEIRDTGIRYGLVAFDSNGIERPELTGKFSQKLVEEVTTQPVTNVLFFSHGWKGDVPAATEQYDRWIGALTKSLDFRKAQQVFPNFRPLFIGLHWPSLPWGNEEARSDGSFAPTGGPGSDELFS